MKITYELRDSMIDQQSSDYPMSSASRRHALEYDCSPINSDIEKSVTFADAQNEIYKIERINPTIAWKVWYSKTEIAEILSRSRKFANLIDIGNFSESKEETARGLENLAKSEDRRQRREWKRQSLKVALNEQHCQDQVGMFDSSMIATLYMDAGATQSQEAATVRGLSDEIEVKNFIETKTKIKGTRMNRCYIGSKALLVAAKRKIRKMQDRYPIGGQR